MSMDLTQDLDTWMLDAFPAQGGNASLEYVSSSLVNDRLRVVMRLIVWDMVEGQKSIRDIKEQEVDLCAQMDAHPGERLQALVAAWALVLPQVLADLGDQVDTLMPDDLAPGDAIRLARSHTRDDFDRALRQKSRLGKFIKS